MTLNGLCHIGISMWCIFRLICRLTACHFGVTKMEHLLQTAFSQYKTNDFVPNSTVKQILKLNFDTRGRWRKNCCEKTIKSYKNFTKAFE
jgi:hypothetical protein